MNDKQDQNTPSPQRAPQGKQGKKSPLSRYKRTPFSYLIIIFALLTAMMMMKPWLSMTDRIRWDEFIAYVETGQIETMTVKETEIVGQFNETGMAARVEKGKKASRSFSVDYNPNWVGEQYLRDLAGENIKISFTRQHIWLIMLMQWVFPLLVLGGFFYFFFARNLRGGAGGMLMSFGRSKHKLQDKDKANVTFDDVAGVQEAKDEVSETIEFLRNPKKFQRLGGRIPRGVLLVGPPGCGKTLLAKAIAGQADVPFFSISGSDFVEMFVGVGASRVRDLFKQAKEHSPCIIFLDEVDAIGRKRGGGFAGGGHDEREQTLNAILVEMDGFDTNDQVIVIAATNRADILDHALTRPGRFDRQIFVPLPDLKGRLEILNVHAKKIKMGPDTVMERLARGTPMFSGADLAAIINEAALAATMANKNHVEMADLEEARDKVRWGRARKSRVIDQKEKEITAFHEAGHTLVQSLLEDADPLHKVSIIPRGPMGGATFALPEKDRTIFTRRYCMALLEVCFGGRIAEELFCDDISSGAQSDIQQATNITRQMVLTWGMSDKLGPIRYGPDLGINEAVYMGAPEKEYSEKTAEAIDNEVRKITDEAYTIAKELIQANKEKLSNIAAALLKYETLDANEVTLILEGGILDKPTVTDLLAAEQAKSEAAKSEPQEQQESQEQQTEPEPQEQPAK